MRKTKLILPIILSSILFSTPIYADVNNTLFNVKTSQELDSSKKDKKMPYKLINISTEIAQLLQIIINNSNGFITGDNIKIEDIPLIVFFDPQCDVCKSIWKNANSENNKNVKAFWIPVGLLDDNSDKLANTIISSSDPKLAMNDLIKGKLVVKETEIGKEKLNTNNYIYGKMEFDSVPLILKITKDNKLAVANNYISETDLRVINNL